MSEIKTKKIEKVSQHRIEIWKRCSAEMHRITREKGDLSAAARYLGIGMSAMRSYMYKGDYRLPKIETLAKWGEDGSVDVIYIMFNKRYSISLASIEHRLLELEKMSEK